MQTIDVSPAAATISGGNVKYTASAYLGAIGNGGGLDSQIAVTFQNASGQTFKSVTLSWQRHIFAGLFLQQQIGLVPTGTTRVIVTLTLSGVGSAADSLSLVFATLGTSPPSVLGSNLVVNPGAESGPNAPPRTTALYVPGWSTSRGVSVAPYGGPGWISTSDPGPIDRGVNLFCGGPSSSGMYQDIDVSPAASLIDTGQVTYQVGAWLGGSGGGSPTLTYQFFDWTDKQLAATGQLGPTRSGAGLISASHSDALPAGTRRVHIVLDFESPFHWADDISFGLTGPAPPPAIDPTLSVQNQTAAPNAKGEAVAPGSLVAIYGTNFASASAAASSIPLSTKLADVSVTFNGVAAPMVGIAPGVKVGNQTVDQINAVVPWGVTPGTAPVVVTHGGVSSAAVNVPIAAAGPGIFYIATDSTGVNRPLVYNNSDNTFSYPARIFGTNLNTRPASIGKDVVVVWCTGLGAVTVTPPDGAPATNASGQFVESDTVARPVVLVGGRQANVTFSGLTQYPSIYQINITLDPATPTGDAVPIQTQMNGVTTTDQLKIAVTN